MTSTFKMASSAPLLSLYMNSGTSRNITIPNNCRGFIVSTGVGSAARGEFYFFTASSNTIYSTEVNHASDITITTSGNTLTITNGNQYGAEIGVFTISTVQPSLA